MEERDLPAAASPGATTAERAGFAQPADPRTGSGATGGADRTDQNASDKNASSRAASDSAGRAAGLAREAVGQASDAASSLRDRVVESAGQQQQAAADQVDSLADTLRRTADSVPREQAWLADLSVRGGETLSDLADTLRRNDLQGLLRKVDGFARNQPALFLGASMAAGFALARVAQVSASQMSGRSSRGEADYRQDMQGDANPQPAARTTVTEGPDPIRRETHAGMSQPRQGDNTETGHG